MAVIGINCYYFFVVDPTSIPTNIFCSFDFVISLFIISLSSFLLLFGLYVLSPTQINRKCKIKMDFNTFFTLFHFTQFLLSFPQSGRNDSSNHKISGYGLVLKDDIIHAPKHTLHSSDFTAADSSESFYCEYYSFPILFSYLESVKPFVNFHDRFHLIAYSMILSSSHFPLFQD